MRLNILLHVIGAWKTHFLIFWQKGIGMQLGKLQTHAHSANFCNNRKLVTVNSGK